MLSDSLNDRHWFVMRDLRRTNAKVTAYQLLMQNGFEAFTPMTLVNNKTTGQNELVPVMQWLVFVHATKREIDEYINPVNPQIPRLQYVFERGKSSKLGGMTVKDRSMNYFRIAVAKQEIPIVYRCADITPDMLGRRVMVTRGDLIGYQGYIQAVTGRKGMRLLVELDGFCLAPVHVRPEDIAFLDEKPQATTPEEERAHYARLSRLIDIINYLRFSVPQDLNALTLTQLTEMRETYRLANSIFDEYHTRNYLCVDELCENRLADIDHKISMRTEACAQEEQCDNNLAELPWVKNMTHLCQQVRLTQEGATKVCG